MAKKGGESRKPNRTRKSAIMFYVSDDVADGLNGYLASLPEDRRPKKRAVVEASIRDYLVKVGYWPASRIESLK